MKPSQLKTGQGKLFTEHQVRQLIRLYEDKLATMQRELQAMQAKRSPGRRLQAFVDAHSAPPAPDVLGETVKLRRERGLM